MRVTNPLLEVDLVLWTNNLWYNFDQGRLVNAGEGVREIVQHVDVW